MLSPEEHQERTRQLTSPDADPRLPDMVAVAVASWLPEGWDHSAVATRGTTRTGIFVYADGILVLRFNTDANAISTAVVRHCEIETVEMTHNSEWYNEYQHGGIEGAAAWANRILPGTALIRLKHAVLDVGREIEFPLPGRDRLYPGDWALISTLRGQVLGLHRAD